MFIVFGTDRQICPSDHCLATVLTIGTDLSVRIPHTHVLLHDGLYHFSLQWHQPHVLLTLVLTVHVIHLAAPIPVSHYANMSVQYTAIFHGCKNVNFQMKKYNIFQIFAQNIDCGYTLEPPR